MADTATLERPQTDETEQQPVVHPETPVMDKDHGPVVEALKEDLAARTQAVESANAQDTSVESHDGVFMSARAWNAIQEMRTSHAEGTPFLYSNYVNQGKLDAKDMEAIEAYTRMHGEPMVGERHPETPERPVMQRVVAEPTRSETLVTPAGSPAPEATPVTSRPAVETPPVTAASAPEGQTWQPPVPESPVAPKTESSSPVDHLPPTEAGARVVTPETTALPVVPEGAVPTPVAVPPVATAEAPIPEPVKATTSTETTLPPEADKKKKRKGGLGLLKWAAPVAGLIAALRPSHEAVTQQQINEAVNQPSEAPVVVTATRPDYGVTVGPEQPPKPEAPYKKGAIEAGEGPTTYLLRTNPDKYQGGIEDVQLYRDARTMLLEQRNDAQWRANNQEFYKGLEALGANPTDEQLTEYFQANPKFLDEIGDPVNVAGDEQ